MSVNPSINQSSVLRTLFFVVIIVACAQASESEFTDVQLLALKSLNEKCVDLTIASCTSHSIEKNELPGSYRSRIKCLNHLLTEFMKDLPFDITYLYKHPILENVLPNCLYPMPQNLTSTNDDLGNKDDDPHPVCPWKWEARERNDTFPSKRMFAKCMCNKCQESKDLALLGKCMPKYMKALIMFDSG